MLNLIQRLSSRPAASSANESSAARDERLRAAFAAVPVGLALCGLDGRWLLFNDAAAEVLGYPRNELSRVSLHELTHPSDLPRENAFLKRLHAGEIQRYRIEKRTLDKQAKYREVVVSASIVRSRAGMRDAIVYAIEKREPKDESGRTADGLSHQILDSLTGTAVLRCDPRGTILGWNRGAHLLFGYSRDEIIGRNRRALYRDGENWSEAAEEDLRVAEERQVLETDDFRRTRDGRELWVKVSLTPFAPDGVLRGFVEVIHPAGAPATMGEAIAEQLREELERERDSGVTLTRVMETLKGKLQAESVRRAELEREVLALRERLASAEAPPVADAHWASLDAEGALSVIDAVSRSGRSGLLIFVAGARQKSIQLVDGRIASCASSDAAQSIGDRLVRRGAISDGQRNKAVEMAAATNVAIGRALVILDILSEGDVANALREKIEDEIADLASWTEGQWTFADREPPRVKPVRASLALSELRAFTRNEFVASRNGTRYHRESCTAMLRVRATERVPVISALTGAERGLGPCRLCVS
ncbi:MAG TPA: PAS domain S-box protein [Thermoanaerobaculia bacterium]